MTDFWAINLKENKAQYDFKEHAVATRTVILDDASKLGPKDHVSVFYEKDGKKALVTRLSLQTPQFPLHMIFTPEEGDDEIPITVEGKCHANLLGYIYPSLDDQIVENLQDLMAEKAMQEEEDDDDDDENEKEEKPQPQKRKQVENKTEQPNKKESKKVESKKVEKKEEKEEKNEPKVDRNKNSKLLQRLPKTIISSIIEKFPYAIGGTIRYRDLNKDKSEIDIASKTVKNGAKVTIKYVCRTYANNAVLDKGTGFSFKVGKGEIISGLEKGIKGLKRGAIRQLLIDPSEAYPDKGVLVFTCEITNVQ